MKKNTVPILFLFLSLWACTQTEQEQAGISKEDADKVEQLVGNTGGEGCFVPYQAKVCEVVPVETVARILGVDAKDVKAEDQMKSLHEMGRNKDKPYKGSPFASCSYTWKDPSGKTIKKYVKQLNMTLETPKTYNISIGGFAPVQDLAAFKAEYRPLTQQELDEISNEAGKQMDKRVADGKNTEPQADMAKDMAKAFMKGRDLAYVEGVGELAARVYTKLTADSAELVVYQHKNRFTVTVDMDTNTREQNLEVAKKIALEVLKICP
jgi:hypothetical protein